jgi:hypothetical protein
LIPVVTGFLRLVRKYRDLKLPDDANLQRATDYRKLGNGCPASGIFQGGKIMGLSITLLAYLGPETMLPMTSVIAGAAGVVMMFGRTFARLLRNSFRAIAPTAKGGPKATRRPRRIGGGPVGGIARGGASRAGIHG